MMFNSPLFQQGAASDERKREGVGGESYLLSLCRCLIDPVRGRIEETETVIILIRWAAIDF